MPRKKKRTRVDDDEAEEPPLTTNVLRQVLTEELAVLKRELKGERKKELDELKRELKGERKKELDELKSEIKGDIASLKNVVLAANPYACIIMNLPAVVTSTRDTHHAVMKGEQATWTVVSIQHDTGTRYFAIGSKHCAFYYQTIAQDKCFVSLPKAIVKAGVKMVGIRDEDGRSCKYADDAVAVEIKKCPDGMEPETITPYKVETDFNVSQATFVVGMSESGPVIGKSLRKDFEERHYVFVEDQGEPGSSGTLMFVPRKTDPSDLHILGTYYGAPSGAMDLLRPHGIVSPLPVSIVDDYQFHYPIDELPNNSQLDVLDKDGNRRCQLKKKTKSNCTYYLLEDGGENWPGVVLPTQFLYNGSLLTGSARSM